MQTISRSPSVAPVPARNQQVAYFDVYVRSSPKAVPWNITEVDRLTRTIPIFPHDEFYLGRGDNCRGEFEDPTVSNRHAKVHCLTFESDGGPPLPPLVYVIDLSSNGTYLIDVGQEEEQRLDKKSVPRLLFENDVLRLGGNTYCFLRFASEAVAVPQLTDIQVLESKACSNLGLPYRLFKTEYEICPQVVGIGGQGAVHVALDGASQRQLACKVIEIQPVRLNEPMSLSLELGDVSAIKKGDSNNGSLAPSTKRRRNSGHARAYREIHLLKELNHPNIVNIEKIFCSNNNIFIFQDLVTGGDLFSFIEFKRNNLQDVEAALILLQVLKGVEYLHDHNIAHRDLKPENILMSSFSAGSRIMLADFGSSIQLPDSELRQGDKVMRMYSLVGTLEYSAPEIHKRNKALSPNQGYSKAVDMWAIGVIASILVSGESIFVDLDNHKYAENPKESILNMASVCDMSVLDAKLSWQSAGKRAKDFVKQLLVLDETKRMTVKQALAHPWFSNRINLDHFQRLYQRAIFDWQPRSTDSRMIQSLSVANLHSPIQFGLPAQATLTTSHHFPRLRSATPNIEPLGSTNTTGGEAQSIHEPVLPQILEWDEEYKSLQYHDQCSTLNQRARNMIAKDIEQMDMSLDMNNLSLESSPRQSDVDMNEADENTGSVIPVTVISPRHQSEHTPNLDCGIIERSESPDPIITASPTVQTTRISSMRNSKPYNPMPSTLDLRKKTKSRNRPSLKTYGVTKLSDMYVGDGFAGMFPHSNMSYRRRTKGRKRPRLN